MSNVKSGLSSPHTVRAQSFILYVRGVLMLQLSDNPQRPDVIATLIIPREGDSEELEFHTEGMAYVEADIHDRSVTLRTTVIGEAVAYRRDDGAITEGSPDEASGTAYAFDLVVTPGRRPLAYMGIRFVEFDSRFGIVHFSKVGLMYRREAGRYAVVMQRTHMASCIRDA